MGQRNAFICLSICRYVTIRHYLCSSGGKEGRKGSAARQRVVGWLARLALCTIDDVPEERAEWLLIENKYHVLLVAVAHCANNELIVERALKCLQWVASLGGRTGTAWSVVLAPLCHYIRQQYHLLLVLSRQSFVRHPDWERDGDADACYILHPTRSIIWFVFK